MTPTSEARLYKARMCIRLCEGLWPEATVGQIETQALRLMDKPLDRILEAIRILEARTLLGSP